MNTADKARAPSKVDKDDVLKEARERLQQSWEADRENREEAATDLRFLAGDQWPAAARREREIDNRPCLTINRLPQFLRQVTNPIREADLSIKTAPVDSNSDPDVAKIFDGLIKQIQYQSSAQTVYATAAEHQSGCGIGWFQVVTDYVDDSVFDQEIKLEGIQSPLSVYDDPAAVKPDRSDSMWRHITEMVPLATFKVKWPDAATEGLDKPSDGSGSLYWADRDAVRISHYWRKVPVKKTLGLLQDGATVDTTDMDPILKRIAGVTQERVCHTHKVEMYVLSGAEVLEGPHPWPGKYLPQIPVIGSEIPVENGVYRHGVIRFARDPQQLYNFSRTAAAEAIALRPKAPYIATAKQIAKHKDLWDTANTKNRPYMLYDHDPNAPGPPKREPPPEVPVAHINEAQSAAEDMKGTTGIYDASLGAQSNEKSGVAIDRRQVQGDTANYHYGDNLQRSLEYCGRVLIDLIPRIYDNERVVRILGDDEAEEFVPINRVIMGEDGMPVVMNDLSTGRFDVRVTIGRSATTKRLETAQFMTEFVKQLDPPQRAAVMDLVAQNIDAPGAEQIAKRLRNMVDPSLMVDPDDPQAPPPPNPMDDPAVQLEMAEKESKIQETQQKTRKTAAEAEGQEIDNALAVNQAAQGLHPTQQDPMQEKVFDAGMKERDAERSSQHRYEDRQWSVEDQRRQAQQGQE